MEDWGAVCEHDISEREVATVADGLCPICLAASCAALRQRAEELEREALSSAPPYYRKWQEYEREINSLREENARLKVLILKGTDEELAAASRRIRAQREEGE